MFNTLNKTEELQELEKKEMKTSDFYKYTERLQVQHVEILHISTENG